MSSTKRTSRLILLLVVVALVGLLAYNKISKDKKAGTEKKMAASGSKDLLLDAYVVKPEELKNNIAASGTLMGNESVALQPQVGGMITHIYFSEGSFVTKGALLVKLFDADLQAQLEKLKLQKDLGQLTLQRQEKLLAINGISQQDVDNSRNQVASLQADMDNIRAQIRKTEIRAPFNGTVGLRDISEGATVSPATVIATLQQTDPLKMDFSVPEKYRNILSKGDAVSFTVSEDPNKKFTGRIYAIEPEIDVNTRTVRMRAILPNPGGKLHPGSFANVHLDMKNTPNALMVPTEAIIQTTRDKQVVLIKNNRVQFATVLTGVSNADKIEVTNGLQPNDTIAITGIMQAKKGVTVKFLSVE